MNVCIIGDGLTSLSFAKYLVDRKIDVQVFHHVKKNNPISNRTIGISKNNFEFFVKEILNIQKKDFWEIKHIEIYSDKLKNKKILSFQETKTYLFCMIKNNKLNKLLNDKLSKNEFFKKNIIKSKDFYQRLLSEKKYDLIINCDSKNFIAKKFFSKTIKKTYNNYAYTTVIKHEISKNNTAIQVFTEYGPIAFLPISKTETSVVYSLDFNKNKYDDKKIINLIQKHNPKYLIKKIKKLERFELKSSSLRNYYHDNIIAFGDCLHKVHPLAGQGFNMTIRDLKVITKIIKNRIDLGMQLDSTTCEEFEKKTRHINFIFSNGIDSIYEFFNFDKSFKDPKLNEILKLIGKNRTLNNMFIKYANEGLNI